MSLVPSPLGPARLVATFCALALLAGAVRAAESAPVERLGARLFFDTALSEPPGVACASCHDPARAFSGVNGSPIAAVARGAAPGAFGVRKAPSLAYAAFTPSFAFIEKADPVTGQMLTVPAGGQFRDGRAESLERQIEGPLLNPAEMNNPSKAAVVEKVKNGAYADLVREVFGPAVFDDPQQGFARLAEAIAAFERSDVFRPFSSRFDDVLRGRARFTPQEARGFALFRSRKKGNCLACHDAEIESRNPRQWLFTDFTYDVLGAPRNAEIPANADPNHFDLGLCKRNGLDHLAPKEFDVERVCGAFKVPTLRNVALTAPYMHNGALKTLREAVAFYATRDTNPERWYPKAADGSVAKYDDLPQKYWDNVNVREVPYDRKPSEAPRLDDEEIDAIVAFLQTLTDRRD